MRVVYDPSHVLHDPVTEVQTGVAMPMYEVPARAESIRAALRGLLGCPPDLPAAP